jgi:oligosaccharide translocation protein RFT1
VCVCLYVCMYVCMYACLPVHQLVPHNQSLTLIATTNVYRRSTIVGAALTPVFCALFMAMPDEHALQHVPVTDYRTSIVLVGISLLLELLCEPMFVVAQGQLRYRARALIEASAVLWRCITTLLLVLFADMRLLAFAYGHVAYGAALLLSYTILFIRQSRACSKRPSAKHHVDKQSADVANSQHCVQSMRELVPTTLRFPASDATIADIALRASGQTVWKLVLTEGEKMVMVGMGVGADDQGVYALVSNLGSLVARFALQPIEETCLTVFGRLHAQQQQSSSSSSSTTSKSNAAAGRPQLSAEHLLALATKSMILLGLVFVAFGTQFSHMLLHLLYGQRWSMTEAPAALSLYCVYILVRRFPFARYHVC